MLNISNGVSLTMDAHGRIQADGLKSLPDDKADETRQHIKACRDSIVEYLTLWNKAWELADYVDGNTAPYEDRIEKLPELNMLNARMTALEFKIKSNPPAPAKQAKPENTREYWDSMIRCRVGTRSSQQVEIQPDALGDDPGQCPACGERQWWRLDKPDSKWICGRCHPPATGLDVIYE
ncbi:hypothetical protein [Desulfobacter sp.]|uniref:hypothetical protein n=1 Tax=Desulfobacter sp. TaxID=2294 RepID=UPI000E7F0154|nr:hypothetical protein [Desulfobacter sp.]HBT87736.1 hypothetical protein [Desulfobacter sp.]